MDPDSRKQDSDSLNPEVMLGIERQFDKSASQTGEFAAAFFHYFIRAVVILLVLIGIAFL